MSQHFTLQQIVAALGGQVTAQPTLTVSRVASLAFAGPDAITFLNDTKYQQALQDTHAAAVILRPEHQHLTDLPCILSDNPYAYFAKLAALLHPTTVYPAGIHTSVTSQSTFAVALAVSIDAQVVIGAQVTLGQGVRIGAGSVIEDGVTIGAHTVIEPRVVIKRGTTIGAHCHIFSGVVIGSDGFGYAEAQGEWVKIPHVGRVQIGNQVDIGANTTIDRGALDDTVIADGVKLDNLIHVAHNVRIGAHTVIAGCVGIAGSAVIGAHCKIGGAAMILGHLQIADGVTISPGTMITRSILQTGTYTALMPFQKHEDWLKTAANIRQLQHHSTKLKQLEQQINNKDLTIKD